MPFKSRERKQRYQREWYAKHRDQVIAEVAHRKRTLYAGVCLNCGGPTVGQTKGQSPSFCGKPECRSRQQRGPLP